MKRFALSMLAAAALSTSAALAGPTPVFNWSGFYIGVNGGGAWSPDRNIFLQETSSGAPFFDGAFGTRRVQGGFGGAQVGYNWQRDHWVFGVEGDAQGASIHGSSREIVTPYLTAGNSITFDTRECMEFFATFRGRAGYAWDSFFIYATAGGALGQTNTRIGMMDTFGFDAAARSRALRGGYAVGAGGEYAFNTNWSVKAEYQYIDLGQAFISAREFVGAVPSAFNVSNTTQHDYHTFRVGVNYKLDGQGTAVYLSPR
jgi:outer membrane immunogenic protein